ncbi:MULTISPECIES: hypothetical protein [Okeania]|nr:MULTISPECIES: hypothetical protein [Okeania]NEP05049.1 hypothetical protein [Okeania sp. SIO4D6]NES75904.1 hypothetical protein [Okeania sp. SIO1H4]NEP73284.1 hypothetical protein [Okeania sp. SIO2G5]NEP91692.1 hypothetical protein [Okeania sp. SIO2F5]NEQ89519.1 hypothetical protein [Okeania sp. SIO2G4]
MKRDGLLTGQLIFSDTALQEALREMSDQQGLGEPIPLSRIEGAKFTFKYVSPYSGAEHTEETLCDKKVYDISEFQDIPLTGGGEPTLALSGGQPEFVDFSSCIEKLSSVSSKISSVDSRVFSSTVDSLFGKLNVYDKDEMGYVLYKRVRPIKFVLKP